MLRLALLLVPTALCAGGMAYMANDHLAGAMIGGVAGFIIGIALNAFPNLDGAGEEERTDLPIIDE